MFFFCWESTSGRISHWGVFIQKAVSLTSCHMSRFRFHDISSLCTSCWRTHLMSTWNARVWNLPNPNWRSCPSERVCTFGRCVVMDGDNVDANDDWLHCQDDARWSEWHGEHQKESGHREDDCRGLWHPVRHESDLRQTRWAASASSTSPGHPGLSDSWRLTHPWLWLRGQALSSSCRPAASEACSVRSVWAPSHWGRKESDSVFCLLNTFSSAPEHLEESFTCSRSAAQVHRRYPNTVEWIT